MDARKRARISKDARRGPATRYELHFDKPIDALLITPDRSERSHKVISFVMIDDVFAYQNCIILLCFNIGPASHHNLLFARLRFPK